MNIKHFFKPNHALLFLFSCFVSLISNAIFAQSVSQVYYIDFGPNDRTNGNSTLQTDQNGHKWNNVTNTSSNAGSVNLVDQNNAYHGMSLAMLLSMSSNGIQNGGLLNPSSNLLRDLAVNTATQDYFHTENKGKFALRGLDSRKGYRFTFFASRDSAERRTTRYTVQGSRSHSYWLRSSGQNIGANVANSNDDEVRVTEIYQPANNGEIHISVEKAAFSFAYINLLKIEVLDGMNFPAAKAPVNSQCLALDEHKIAFMGSSVAWGHGAENPGGPYDHYISFDENRRGYALNFAEQLSAMYNPGNNTRWWVSNVSISGNNTTNVLNRWNNDLLPECAKYVVYGLSLANEGIMSDGGAFDRFRNNMTTLIRNSRNNGMVPVVINNYANNSYNSGHYNSIMDMDMLIHNWDLPSVNVLGTLDDLQGHFPSGYFYDGGHPNNNGYKEFFTAITPSLFVALDNNKPRPNKMPTSSLALSNNEALEFSPQGTVHPITVLFDVRTTGQGNLMQIATQNGTATIRINSQGRAEYVAPNNAVITSGISVNNNAWHTIAVTHYYAQGVTRLYVDGQRQGGAVNERIATQKFTLKGINSSTYVRNLMFYRSGMNDKEFAALQNGQLLQSSLALYAPLDGQGRNIQDAIHNYAQSTNTLHYNSTNSAVTLYQHCNYQGHAVALGEGSYDLGQLNALGVNNDDISSLRVQTGYKITLYRDWDFTGTTLTKTGDDSCLVDDGYNDDISSVVISRSAPSWSTTIEAENHTNFSGVETEACSEGGLNVGWTDAGDWMVWNVDLPVSGTYKVEYRVAGENGGIIQLERAGGSPVFGQKSVPITGGWQTWQTISHTVNLQAGPQEVAIYVLEGGFNINWLRLTAQ